MAYSDVKAQFLGLLNRRDITPTLADTFLSFGIQRIQRELRVPAMEKMIEVITDGTAKISVPGDLLQVIALHTNDQVNQKKLIRTDLQTILDYAKIPGTPQFYYREGATFYLGPYPPENTTIFVNYYADVSSLTADTDTNWLTEVAPALLIYAGLAYAADYYLDDRKGLFETSYQQIADQLTFMAAQDEVENASIRSAYDSTPNYVGPYYGR